MKSVTFLFLLVVYSYFHVKTVASYLVNTTFHIKHFDLGWCGDQFATWSLDHYDYSVSNSETTHCFS